jgi:hypothetical protein
VSFVVRDLASGGVHPCRRASPIALTRDLVIHNGLLGLMLTLAQNLIVHENDL